MATTKKQDLTTFENVDESRVDELLAGFDKVDNNQLMQLNAEYLAFKPNSTYSFIFTGLGEFTAKEGNLVTVVKLMDKGRKQYISGAKVLVNTLKVVTQVPCLVKIITKNEIKSENGKYIAMDIFVIPQELAARPELPANEEAKEDLPF